MMGNNMDNDTPETRGAGGEVGTTERRSRRPLLVEILKMRDTGLILVLILMGVVLTFLAPKSFPTTYNLFNVLRDVSYISISAFGECMVIITAGIDLSVGSVMGLAGIMSALTLAGGMSTPIGVLAGMATGAFFGFVNGILISKAKMQPFIITLGTMSIVRGLCYGITGGWPIPSKGRAGVASLPDSFLLLGRGMVLETVPYPVIFMIVLGLIIAFFLNRTITGKHIFATGDNPQAARVAGIRTENIKLMVYTLCGFLSGIGGILMTARLGTGDPRGASSYELDIIAAVVLGGTSLMGGEGSLPGVILAAAFMRLIRNGLTLLGSDPYWQPVAIGSVIIAGAMIDRYSKGRKVE
jgi:ribose transport system permease protein